MISENGYSKSSTQWLANEKYRVFELVCMEFWVQPHYTPAFRLKCKRKRKERMNNNREGVTNQMWNVFDKKFFPYFYHFQITLNRVVVTENRIISKLFWQDDKILKRKTLKIWLKEISLVLNSLSQNENDKTECIAENYIPYG